MVMENKKHTIYRISLFSLIFLIHMASIYGTEIQLERNKILIDYKDKGYFASVTDLKVYKDFLFVVDFRYNQVLKFKYKDIVEFLSFIGKKGQGPGDLQNPFSISINDDIVSIIDQGFVSFFDIKGNYISRFRLFSVFIDSLFSNKLFFHLATNPKSNHLFEVYTIEGKRIKTFGEKYLRFKYNVKKSQSAAFIERTIYDGDLLSDGNFIYYINRRFGILQKYSLSGNLVLHKDLIPIFEKNEQRKADKNRTLFIENEYILNKNNPTITRYDIFLKVKVIK